MSTLTFVIIKVETPPIPQLLYYFFLNFTFYLIISNILIVPSLDHKKMGELKKKRYTHTFFLIKYRLNFFSFLNNLHILKNHPMLPLFCEET